MEPALITYFYDGAIIRRDISREFIAENILSIEDCDENYITLLGGGELYVMSVTWKMKHERIQVRAVTRVNSEH